MSMPYKFEAEVKSSSRGWELLRFRDQKYSGRIKQPQRLIGPPVLFVLGHMGHYGQARSLGTQGWFAAYLAEKCQALSKASSQQSAPPPLICEQANDYAPFETFILDTSDSLVGVGGGLLLSQANHVAKAVSTLQRLYAQPMDNPQKHSSKVHIVTHSMGTIAAFAAFSDWSLSDFSSPQAAPASQVASVFSLAAPLHVPPVPLSPVMLYAYFSAWRGMRRLSAVPQVHIQAGARDRLLWFGELWRGHSLSAGSSAPDRGDGQHLNVIVPFLKPVHGVFVDHVSVTWCRQVASGIAHSITVLSNSSSRAHAQQDSTLEAHAPPDLYDVWSTALQHRAHAAEWASAETRRRQELQQRGREARAALEGALRQVLGSYYALHVLERWDAARQWASTPVEADGPPGEHALQLAVQMGAGAGLPALAMIAIMWHAQGLKALRRLVVSVSPAVGSAAHVAAAACVAAGVAVLQLPERSALIDSCVVFGLWHMLALLGGKGEWLLWGGAAGPVVALVRGAQWLPLAVLLVWSWAIWYWLLSMIRFSCCQQTKSVLVASLVLLGSVVPLLVEFGAAVL